MALTEFPCLSGSAPGSMPQSTLAVTTVTSWLASKACRRARHWARHVMVARNLIRRSRRRAHHGQLVTALLRLLRYWRCCVIVPYTHCRTRHVVDVVVRDAIVMSTPVSWTVSGSARQDFVSTNCFLELWFFKASEVHASQSYFKNSNCFSFLN